MQLPTSLAQTLTNLNLPTYPSVTGLPQPITLRSLAAFAGALIWAWLLLVSFAGWGRLTGKLFRVQRLPASVACSLGIGAIVFLGGWLNLLHAIYPSVMFALTAIGLVFYIALWRQRPEKYRWLPFWTDATRWSKLFLGIAFLILFLRVAATVRLGNFNVSDDSAAYLIFPQKMLAVHHFATDPFSDRRVISSLGGAYLLQSFVVAATSLPHIAMADRTLGFILLAGALFDVGIFFGLSAFQIALLELLVYLTPQETINLTFVVLPISLLFGMIWLIFQIEENEHVSRLRNALLIGVIGGAIISLKSTYVPIVGAYALVPCLFTVWRPKQIKNHWPLIAIGSGSFIVLVGWMIAMKMTSGTYMFPILGSGVDYSAYGLFRSMSRFSTHRSVIKVFLQGIALAVLICVQLLTGVKNKRFRISLWILAASALAITAFNYRSGGDFIWRYNFPQFLCAIVIFYAVTGAALREYPGAAKVRRASYVGILSLAGMMFYYDAAGHNPRPFRQVRIEEGDYRRSLRASLSGVALASPQMSAEYQAVEAVLPDRETALENVGRPYLFNYQTHKIYVMDWPGAASPPPGWPYGQNSTQLASYLRRNSVRYVLYDYRYSPWYDVGACVSLEQPGLYSRELYVLFWMSVLADHQFDQLRTQYHSLYDDGQIAVIDLDRPRPDAPAPTASWTLNTSKEQMCSAVLARYIANPLPESSR